jgi:hypothetical protein
VLGGTILLILVMTTLKRVTNLPLYSGPTANPAISLKHFNATLRKSGTSRNYPSASDLKTESDKLTLETKKSMICVSKIYPRGIQYRNLNNVSRVALIKLGLFAFSSTSLHKLKISPNSAHILCFNALVFACVICSAEKSKISSDKSLRMTMLFSQRDRDVREEATISGMKDGQSLGHACFRI